MGLFSSTTKTAGPEWKMLESENQLQSILNDQSGKLHVIFKHSTRCGISSMAKKTFERGFEPHEDVQVWLLDLLQFRNISNEIAIQTKIEHQSPQIIVLRNGQVEHHASHHSINPSNIANII